MKLNNISGNPRLRDVLVSPVGLLRLSAILVVLLMVGHTSAYPWASTHALHETQLVELMKSVDFEFAGERSTYWSLYYGWGLLISVLLLTMGIVLWLMADLARLAPRRVGVITGILSASALVGAYLSWRFFYIPPFIFDSQEVDPRLHEAFAAADKKAERAVGNVKRDGRFIVHFWGAKKRILKSDFGIDWKSPAELNPAMPYGVYGAPQLTDVECSELAKLVDMHNKVKTEVIKGMWRDLYGAVMVSMLISDDGDSAVYSFTGHDRSWQFIGRDVVQE